MKQAKVIGRVFCSRQCCSVDKRTLLLLQPLDWDTDEPAGEPITAADCVGAGAGEKVFFVQAREAVVAFQDLDTETSAGTEPPPVDAAILGIIDGKSVTCDM
ncbi:MAG: EutN/CcmL family microcompartment protein [Elusimicrobia bacterium]|nr:EutN/CcmL family microcompartment protein [Elusimicrobiota bacterium]